MKEVSIYECEFCGFNSKNQTEMEKHEKSCEKNPEVIEANRVATEDEIAIEQIRLNAESINDVIDGVIAFLATKDITITFEKYPSRFTKKIYGSHDKPMFRKFEKDDKGRYPYYVGWEGDWKGTITNNGKVDGGRDLSFGNIVGKFKRYEFLIPFMYTSSGSFGKNFSGSGGMFIEDFPKIYAKFETEIITDEINLQFTKSVKNLKDEYDKGMYEFIDKDPFITEITRTRNILNDSWQRLSDAENKHKDFLKVQYKKNNFLELPKVESPYLDIGLYSSIRADFMSVHTKHPKDVTAIINENVERIKTIVEKFKKLVDDRPSLFC